MGLLLGSLSLAGCNNQPASSQKSGGEVSSEEEESSSERNFPDRTVKIDYDNGQPATVKTVKLGDKIEKPADPTAPSGKKFYGWMNVKNGGQIWNFTDNTLGVVMDDVELKPLFVPADQNAQAFEAELCPDITEKIGKDGTPGMDGVTYSGGQKGTGLIGRDYYDNGKNEFGSSGLYTRDENGIASYATQADTTNPDKSVFGAFVNYNYEKGNTLTWKVTCAEAMENVTLFMRLSAEYGLDEQYQVFEGQGESRVSEWFDDTMFPVKVNGTALKYGKITIHNIIPKTFITFQDYLVGTTVSLNAGENTIQMIVDNNQTLNGTIASSAPVVDCIKLYAPNNITWSLAKLSQMNHSDAN